MSTKFIVSDQVVGVNGQAYIYPDYIQGVVNGISKQLNCENLAIVNSFWKIPWVQNGQVTKYTYEVAVNTSVPPTADSIKVLIVKDELDQTEYEIAIANSDNMVTSSPPNELTYLCNGSGGSLPVMPNVTIPFPIVQFGPTSVDGSGNNVFTIPFPSNPLGLLYSIPAPWFDGLAPGTAYAPAGITTAAQFVTWANTNWSAYGTWAHSGDVVTLTANGTSPEKVGIYVALQLKAYCFDLSAYSTPALVNQVKFGSGGTLISVTPFMLTNNPNLLAAQLAKVMPSSTTFVTSVTHKLGVNSLTDVPKLYNSGTLVVTSTAGACS